jgi:hypothetical protein
VSAWRWLPVLLLLACGDAPQNESCAPPVVYSSETCGNAPDVGFCVPAEHVSAAEALLPTMICGTALPSCAESTVSCRFAPPVDDDDAPCNETRVRAYNSGICRLWVPGFAVSVTAIPLD